MAVAAARPAAPVMSAAGATGNTARPTKATVQPAGLRADSAGFGAAQGGSARCVSVPARPEEPMDYPMFAAMFLVAAEKDGKGNLRDVPPSVIDGLRREGLSPLDAVFRVRTDRIRAGSAGFAPIARMLDHLESARKTRMG